MANPNFEAVTELSGEDISAEQLFRMCNRYFWAADFCNNKDVLEVACGTGPGLGYLSKFANSVAAGDISESIVRRAQAHYQDRIPISVLDAAHTGFGASSFDVIIIFEALYYLPDASAFVAECKRILRPGGLVLISNANKDLYDFSPSPYSHAYHGVVELHELFSENGFCTEFYGSTPISAVSQRQRLLRPLKAIASRLGLMPKSMTSKKFLKRLVFGRPIKMPAEIEEGMAQRETAAILETGRPDYSHKVIYCKAKLKH
jgi:SAM-dependent methyltransferase